MDISNEQKSKIEKSNKKFNKAYKELDRIFDSAHQKRSEIKERIDNVKYKRELNYINNEYLI